MFNTTHLSSSIDWCENNYEVTYHIAEFVNSFSSLFISVVGLIGTHYHPNITVLYINLILIGLTSFYFHSTLSVAGQMADELSIMVAIISTTIYINSFILRWIPNGLMLFISIIKFVSMFIFPEFNRFILFTWSLVILKYFKYFYDMSSNKIKHNIKMAVMYFATATSCWLIDYMCIHNLSLYYLHGWWHILIGMCGYYVFVAIDDMTIESFSNYNMHNMNKRTPKYNMIV